ncbi:MAG: type I CRISPR-associated protein Cas7, partial [Firmicutes bacterium]|nr:type I CRISPR-associated protein Cas7 [Bacillota bacterium]
KGRIFGSDKAIKYPMKVKWVNEDEKVLYIKSYKEEKNAISPKALGERYEELFGEKVAKKTSTNEVVSNLFKCVDVMNFGATFAEAGCNISITGAVQFGQGFNLYEDTRVEVQDILSPFRNSKKDDANNSSLGTKIIADETHYCYPFSINPENYNNYKGLINGFEGYTKDAYEKFKDAALISATAFATNSKFACENEYSIFVEMKEGSKQALPNLARYVEFSKEKNMSILDINKLGKLSNQINDIESVEVYYNPITIDIKNCETCKNIKVFNILTREVM